jgi:carbonic anhydrase
VVLGHTHCGAIQSACDGVEQGHITHLLAKIKPAIQAETETRHERCGKNPIFVQHVTQYNVANTLSKIYEDSSILKQMIDDETVGVVGAIYDVQSGQVSFDDYASTLERLYPDTPKLLRQKINELFMEELESVS